MLIINTQYANECQMTSCLDTDMCLQGSLDFARCAGSVDVLVKNHKEIPDNIPLKAAYI